MVRAITFVATSFCSHKLYIYEDAYHDVLLLCYISYSFHLFKIFVFIKSLSVSNTNYYFFVGYKDKKDVYLYTFKDSTQ